MKKPVLLAIIALLFCSVNLNAQTPAAVWVLRANQDMISKDLAKAISDCNEALTIDENNIQAYAIRATAYFGLGKNERSITDFNTIITIVQQKGSSGTEAIYKSYLAGAYLGLGENYQKLGKNDEANTNYQRAIAYRPDLVFTYQMKARSETASHKYEDAILDYTKVIELNPKEAKAYLGRAFALEALRRYEEGIADDAKAAELDPGNSVAFNNLGYDKTRMGKYAEAEIDLHKAIDLLPHHGFALRGLGVIKYWQGNYEEAIAILNEAIEYHQKVPEGYDFRGLAETRAGKYTEAMNDFNKAIELKPANADAYLNMGELQIYTTDYQSAIASLNKSIAIDTGMARTYNSLGYAWFKAKDYTKAIAYFDTAKIKGGKAYQPYFQYRDESVAMLNHTGKGPFTHLEWIGPIEDINKMYQNTFFSTTPSITVRVKISSVKPIVKNDIQLLLNDKPQTAAGQLKAPGNDTFNKLTGEFEYEYKADLLLATGTSTISVVYDHKSAQVLNVKYN